ncbi:hypothetical protein GGH96_002345 [Coemansia sp. RSA 1972]|nr:hypothetical protein GGH96_002345 [Coemansia sp. RSA 1972]
MKKFNSFFKDVNGLKMAEQKPIHYFVCSEGSDSLNLNNLTEENTIVEYFDSEDVVDFAKFAEIVKTKPNCVQKHFIVNKGYEYCAVETDNVELTYAFSSIRRYQFVPKLAEGSVTIDMLIEKDKRLEDMAIKLETIREEGSDSLLLNNAAEDNTLVKYFDGNEGVYLVKFASIWIVPALAAGTVTIDTFIKEDKLAKAKRAKFARKPGFKLHDGNGKIIPDGKAFAIQILHNPKKEPYEKDYEEAKGLPKDKLFSRNGMDMHQRKSWQRQG